VNNSFSLSQLMEYWVEGYARIKGLPLEHQSDAVRIKSPKEDLKWEFFAAEPEDAVLDRLIDVVAGHPERMLTIVTSRLDSYRRRTGEQLVVASDNRKFMRFPVVADKGVELPEGFGFRVESDGPVHTVTVTTEEGEPAARGMVHVNGTIAVSEHVGTLEQYRRQGLGFAVTALLNNVAYDAGAREHLLVASEQGQMLYERIGWEALGSVLELRAKTT
jgi:GNAT superfamily N-acetyltransferase